MRIPYKQIVHIALIVFIACQLVRFGEHRNIQKLKRKAANRAKAQAVAASMDRKFSRTPLDYARDVLEGKLNIN